MILRSVFLLATAASLSVSAAAQHPGSGTVPTVTPSLDALNLDYEKRAGALQQEMTALRKADGGVLTPTHLTLLQKKLEDLLGSYRRDLERDHPLSVNADGSPVL
jgi:hypothetical protein